VVADHLLMSPTASAPPPQQPWWREVTRAHWLVFIGCWLGGVFDGMDSNIFSVLLPDALRELANTSDKAVIGYLGSVVTFVFLVGWMLGGVAFGWIGDRYGRVKAMIGSILLYALFTGAAGFAQTPAQLAICRFLTGLGIGGELVSIATLLSETWPERSRAFSVGSLLTSYQVGVLLSGVLSEWIPSWRVVFMVGALPALTAIFIRLKMDEPEKWQAEQARHQQAGGAETSSAPGGWREVFTPAYRRDVWVGAIAFGALLTGYWASLVWIPTWIQSLPGITGKEKAIATIWHGAVASLGCLSAGGLANWLGRRWSISFSFLGCFAASALLFLTNAKFTPVIYLQDALLGFFIGLCQSLLYIYLPELFPTRVRASATGVCLNAGRVCAAVGALNVGVLVVALGGYAQAAFTFAAVAYPLGALAVLFGRETRGKPLPD
jgi:MFS family permease